MSIEKDQRCIDVEESIADVLEGIAPAPLLDHIAECDRCRDFKYDAEQASLALGYVGADFHPTDGFADRMLGLVLEVRPDGPVPSASASAVHPRGSLLDPPTSGPQTKSSAAERVSDPIMTAHTEFAPPTDGSGVDSNATVFDPTAALPDGRTMIGGDVTDTNQTMISAEEASLTKIDPDPGIDPYQPTHKTIPLSAIKNLTPMPADSPHRIVEATTGRNNTGGQGQVFDSRPISTQRGRGGPTAGAAPVGPTLPADTQPSKSASTAGSRSGNAVRIAPKAPARKGEVVSLFRRKSFITALVASMAAAAAVGGLLLRKHKGEEQQVATVDGAWSGTVEAVARASSDGESGFEVCKGKTCKPGSAGLAFEAGSTLKTDSKTRARVKLADETWIAIDRNSEVTLPAGPTRQAKVERGMIVADVNHVEGAQPAKISLPQGEVQVIGTKVACTVTDRRASVEVVRGEVSVTSTATGTSTNVRAGEEATISDQGDPIVATKTTMSDVLEWSSENADDVDAPTLRGVGELRAKKLGTKEERVGAVRLTKHHMKIRVVDVVARTEIDETFTNTTDEELEGIFRFPLPPGAQIENLSLEVDGKLVQGAFVERGRGAAIFRGAEQNATPKAPKPKEEIIWVAGPWHDPALLEWQRGGRFELKIFPIPKKSSRRIVLTYTQTVPQSGGIRRFTYPLAHDASGSTKIDDFNVDLQILDHDAQFGVESRGYTFAKAEASGGAERFTLSEKNFVPAGDLTVEYALPKREEGLTAWAYQMPKAVPVPSSIPAPPPPLPKPGEKVNPAEVEARRIAEDTSPYVALSVRPKLPRFPEGKERLHVLVVDASRSMVGERFARATRLAASIVREMDRRDQFMVLACDTTCAAMGSADGRNLPLPSEPSAEAAQQVESFLGAIEPDGGSNLLAAVQAARTAAGAASGRELRILYLGDGTPTVGPTKPATVEAAVKHVLPSGDGSVIAVALGSDADTTSLAAMARGGNGVVVPYVPGQRVSAAAVDVLASAYGSVLSDVEVILPSGLAEITPQRLDPIPAGGEAFILARMPAGQQVSGKVVLRGRIGNERFEQSYDANITASTKGGNAFIPRMFAAAKIGELEARGGADDRDRIVALSSQFNVASRHTSLLVLESDKMFEAFGVQRNGLKPAFTGEEGAESTSSHAEGDAGEAEERLDDASGADTTLSKDKEKSEGKKSRRETASEEAPAADEPALRATPGAVAGNGGAARGPAPAQPSPTMTAPPTTPPAPPQTIASEPSPAKKPATGSTTGKAADRSDPFDPSWGSRPQNRPRPPQRMIPMKKVFDRKGSFSTDKLLATEVAKSLVEAESALKASPDSRDKTIALYKALMASGRVGEALEIAAKWSQRDALDPDALLARADLAAMNGDRERAIRILSGLADVRPGDKLIQKRLASAFTQMGLPQIACQHRIALAEIDTADTAAMAAAVRCTQDQGLSNLAQTVLANAPSNLRSKIETAASSLKLGDLPALAGDVRVSATWNTPADLDIALVDKNGRRLSWLGSTIQNVNVTAKDATSTNSETLSVSGLSSGNLMVEIVRARSDKSQGPITGELTFTLPGGETRKVPFTVTNQRSDVGSLRIFFTSRLVPVTDPSVRWR